MADVCPGYQPVALDAEHVPVDTAAVTDREWHLSPLHPHAFCGGCGMDTDLCHEGFCCTEAEDLMGVHETVCDLCSHRHQTGQAVAPR